MASDMLIVKQNMMNNNFATITLQQWIKHIKLLSYYIAAVCCRVSWEFPQHS